VKNARHRVAAAGTVLQTSPYWRPSRLTLYLL